MHPLNNGSQVIAPPAIKPQVGDAGYFSESNDNGAPSYPGADWFNANIKEFTNLLNAAGIEFEFGEFDHLVQAIQQLSIIQAKQTIWDSLIGFPLFDTIPNCDRSAIALRADGVEVDRVDYPKLWNKMKHTAVDQTLINANPKEYAARYGTGDGSTTFTMPNLTLMPWLVVAGFYGVAGTTVDDQIQQLTGKFETLDIVGDESPNGVFYQSSKNTYVAQSSTNGIQLNDESVSFDASRVARTGDYTRPPSTFFDLYIIHGEI